MEVGIKENTKRINKYLNGKNNRQLIRGRQFERERTWNKDSIYYRLATRAIQEMEEISYSRSKNGLKTNYNTRIQC